MLESEACPVGYNMVDWPRSSRRGDGATLVYSGSLTVRKIDVDEKMTFEFSDWFIQSEPHKPPSLAIYRPPYPDDHIVATETFSLN